MQHKPIQLAVVDMAGTTVMDDGLVVNAFEAAATAVGVPESGPEREQRPAVRPRHHGPIQDQRVPRAVRQRGARAAGQRRLRARVRTASSTKEKPRRSQARQKRSRRLRENGIRVALTTGFSGTTQEKLFAALGWQSLADLVLAPGDGVRGRPYPDLILTALIRLEADGVSTSPRSVTPAATSKARCVPVWPSPRARSPARTTSANSATREPPTSSGPSPTSPI